MRLETGLISKANFLNPHGHHVENKSGITPLCLGFDLIEVPLLSGRK